MIICLSGQKRSGKDTCAEILTKQYNFTQISLADPIRKLGSDVFDIPLNYFTDDDMKENHFDKPVVLKHTHVTKIIDIVNLDWGFDITPDMELKMFECQGTELKHPRHILQFVGTEMLRNNIDKDIFLKLADKRIANTDKSVVVSDCRFENERKWFKNKGAALVLIVRPSQTSSDSHVSENEMGTEADYDVIMKNDTSLGRFQIEVSQWAGIKLTRRSY